MALKCCRWKGQKGTPVRHPSSFHSSPLPQPLTCQLADATWISQNFIHFLSHCAAFSRTSCVVYNSWLFGWAQAVLYTLSQCGKKKWHSSLNVYGFFATFVCVLLFVSVIIEVRGFDKSTFMPPSFSLMLVLILIFAFDFPWNLLLTHRSVIQFCCLCILYWLLFVAFSCHIRLGVFATEWGCWMFCKPFFRFLWEIILRGLLFKNFCNDYFCFYLCSRIFSHNNFYFLFLKILFSDYRYDMWRMRDSECLKHVLFIRGPMTCFSTWDTMYFWIRGLTVWKEYRVCLVNSRQMQLTMFAPHYKGVTRVVCHLHF